MEEEGSKDEREATRRMRYFTLHNSNLLTYLVHTVKELQKDGRPLVGACWVTEPLLELVPK